MVRDVAFFFFFNENSCNWYVDYGFFPLDINEMELEEREYTVSFQTLTHTMTHLYPCNFEHFIPGQKSSVNGIITEAHSGTEMHHKDLLEIQGSDL